MPTKRKAAKWIKWSCPHPTLLELSIPLNEVVTVRLKDGRILTRKVQSLNWRTRGVPYDIIAYKRAPQTKEDKLKALGITCAADVVALTSFLETLNQHFKSLIQILGEE